MIVNSKDRNHPYDLVIKFRWLLVMFSDCNLLMVYDIMMMIVVNDNGLLMADNA